MSEDTNFVSINNILDMLHTDRNNDVDLRSGLKELFSCKDFLIKLNEPIGTMNRGYSPCVFEKSFLSLRNELFKERIKTIIDQLFSEAQPESLDNFRYYVNLLEAAYYLKIKRNIYDIVLSNLYNDHFKLKKINGMDIYLIMIQYAASFEVTSNNEKKVLEICYENLKYPDYAPIAYRWAYEIDHSRAITWMDKLIYLLGVIEGEKHEILEQLRGVFNKPWINEILNANIYYFLNEVFPEIIKVGLLEELRALGIDIYYQDFDIGERQRSTMIISIDNNIILNTELEVKNLYGFYMSLKNLRSAMPMADISFEEINLNFEKKLKELTNY